MKQKIKDGDEFELYGIKVIARSSCPKDKVYLVNDKLFSGGHSNGKSNYWDILKKSVEVKL